MIIHSYCKKSGCAITILRQEVGAEQCARKEEGRKEQPRPMKFWLGTNVLKVKLQYSVQPTQSQINGTETLSRAIAYTPPKIREAFKPAGVYPLMPRSLPHPLHPPLLIPLILLLPPPLSKLTMGFQVLHSPIEAGACGVLPVDVTRRKV